MPRTIAIHGSAGEVMAPLGHSDTFFRGKHQVVQVTSLSFDESDPLIIREALIGLLIPIIFTADQLKDQGANLQLPDGCILAYASDIIKALQDAGKHEAQEVLRSLLIQDLDMYVLPANTFKFIN